MPSLTTLDIKKVVWKARGVRCNFRDSLWEVGRMFDIKFPLDSIYLHYFPGLLPPSLPGGVAHPVWCGACAMEISLLDWLLTLSGIIRKGKVSTECSLPHTSSMTGGREGGVVVVSLCWKVAWGFSYRTVFISHFALPRALWVRSKIMKSSGIASVGAGERERKLRNTGRS